MICQIAVGVVLVDHGKIHKIFHRRKAGESGVHGAKWMGNHPKE
jgi:hypothetical protein